MRKVKDVLSEIKELKNESELIDKIVQKMVQDRTVSEYMEKTFEIGFPSLSKIRMRLEQQAKDLERTLNCPRCVP